MNIALIGYGKMGRTIEEIALSRNHKTNAIIDISNPNSVSIDQLKNIDIAFEFTSLESAFSNIIKCFELKIPVVCGSTGWTNQFPQIEKYCKQLNGSFFYSSNFSLGVNILFEINRKLAEIMNEFGDYDIQLEEIHHKQKLDSPSGTAISLVNDILQKVNRKAHWVNNEKPSVADINIISKRIENVPGTHTIMYNSDVDSIELSHKAKNRKGFGLGAVLAGEFLAGKTGVYTMKDLLKI